MQFAADDPLLIFAAVTMGHHFDSGVRCPLTAYQRDIWIANSRLPDNSQFNFSTCARLEGELDFDLLKECAARVIDRHEPWHIRLAEMDGEPHQWLEWEKPEIPIVDFSREPDPAAACKAWREYSLSRPFSIEKNRLIDVALLREGDSVVHVYSKVHHIIADGFAAIRLTDEVVADYVHVQRTGEPAKLSASSYLDFVDEEARYLASAEYERDVEFFRTELAGVSPTLFARKAKSGERTTAHHRLTIDGRIIKQIQESGAAISAYFTAVLAIYASRVHGREEIVLGIPFANRQGDIARRVCGHVANMLPLRMPLAGGVTMRELVAGTRTALSTLRPHERLSMGDVMREAVPRGTGPLFDVTFSYMRLPSPTEAPGITRGTLEPTMLLHDSDALSITALSFEGNDALYLDFYYAQDVFDEDMPSARVAQSIQALVEQSLANLDRPISELELVDEAARAALLETGTGSRTSYRRDTTVHGLFEEQVARIPDHVAITAADGATLTYAQLDARANRLARVLREEDGVGPDDRVAVRMERSPGMLVALLGVMKAGGAYVPIDPGYPEERIRFLLADSRAKAVIDAERLRRIEAQAGPSTPLEPLAGPESLAYVIYTSGSTGNPKGAMVEHHSVINRLTWMQTAYPLQSGDVLLQKTPISFDVSVWELFWWAIEGAGLALLPPGAEKDPLEILRAIGTRKVSALHFVPSMFGPFLDALEGAPERRAETASLRFVFCSGEALPPARVEQFNRIFAGAGPRLVNLYGPTEATVDVSYFDCPPDASVARVPIGRPIDNMRLYVLDAYGKLQPPGVPGELCIAGVGVARGYLDRSELTLEKFRDDPFVAGGRMYRTGDLARWLSDGNLEYLGRLDGQVKIRGNRVELGEVSNTVTKLRGVHDAVVLDHVSEARGTQLVAYYVSDQDLDDGALRAELRVSLPEYMIPARFLRIARIPLTPNGKADRKALAAFSHAEAPRPYEASRTELEAAIAAVWAEVLGVERVGVHDDYHALGGDSITALRVRALAAGRGVHFSLTDLVRHPTVAQLAARATSLEAADEALEPFKLVSRVDRAQLEDCEDAYPVTRLQLGMLYHSRQHPRSAVYQDVFRYTLVLPWEEAFFRQAFDKLVARHPALRTSFELGGHAEPLQLVRRAVRGGLTMADLRARSEADAEAEIRRHIDERRFHPYRFDQAPLYHFRVHVRPEVVELVFSFHHAILDGGSVANLLRELLQDYLHALGHGIEAVAEPSPPSPAHHVREERRALESEEARAYWRRKLEGASLLELPPFGSYEPPGEGEAVVRYIAFPEGLEIVVREFARAHAIPVKSVLFAAYCQTLRLFSGTDDITTGLITHGRPEREGADRMAGLFLNTVPVRLGSGASSWLEAARETFRQEQEGHAHRRYPLSAIQADTASEVLDTAFNYVHFHVLAAVLELPGVALRRFESWEETNLALLVNAITNVDDGRMRLRIDARRNALSADQVGLFGEAYVRILRRMLEHPHDAPDFASLSAIDVVRQFEAQAARTPEAIAVRFGDTRWTYRELDCAANGIARRLLAAGGTPGAMTVGLAVERSPEMIAAVLGIAKAGGACVPLDPSYPKARLDAMIEQVRPFRILTRDDLGPVQDHSSGPLPEIPLASAAYILFTSGSTGTPKGVVMPHRALANLVRWQNRIATAATGGVTLQYAPLSFDVSFQEIYATLCSGGALQLVSEDERHDMRTLLQLLDRNEVERIFMPYVALQQLAEMASALRTRPRGLRVVISSGEQLRITSAIRRLCAGAILENQYGPTETHVVTSFAMTGDPEAFPTLPPIGSAIDGAEVHVLDAQLRPVPPGVRGEIYVGGRCLADGYLGRPDLTEERFRPHPFGADGDRLYRTGDLGMVLPSGAIVCLGRADEQVKVRGFRVEPAEVERAITDLGAEYPGLREAAVVVTRRRNGDAFLAAFLVGDANEVSLEAITERLRSVLPKHMVPSHLEWIESLPRTPSGKRDNEALRKRPIAQKPAASSNGRAPADAYERVLVETLADLLQRSDVGVEDDMFALGGTSLTAMRLVMMIEQRFGAHVPLSHLLKAPTAAALAAHLRRDGATDAFDPLVSIRPGGTRPPLFLVHPMGGNVLCYLPLARHLPGEQPLYALQAAGADAGGVPLESVPELAANYLAAMRRVQPVGPYAIGGWSFGGFVAFEMARQLREGGEEIAQLFIIDTVALSPDERTRAADEFVLGWFFWELLWLERGASAPMDAIPSNLVTLEEKFDFIARQAIQLGVLPGGSSGATARRLFEVYKANSRATLDYRPGVLDRDITLLRAARPLPEVLRPMHDSAGSMYRDPANGWTGRTTAKLEVVEIPGDHLTMMAEPNVQHLTAAIIEKIGQNKCETPRPSSWAPESAGWQPPSPSVASESTSKFGSKPPSSKPPGRVFPSLAMRWLPSSYLASISAWARSAVPWGRLRKSSTPKARHS